MHKLAHILGVVAGTFVLGLLVYTATKTFAPMALRGDTSGISSTSMPPEEPPSGEWFFESDLSPAGSEAMGEIGNDTETGDSGGTGGGGSACKTETKTVERHSPQRSKPGPVCVCGLNPANIANNLLSSLKGRMRDVCKKDQGPSCSYQCMKDGDATVLPTPLINPVISGTSTSGPTPRGCRQGESRYCWDSWSFSCEIKQPCKDPTVSSAAGTTGGGDTGGGSYESSPGSVVEETW